MSPLVIISIACGAEYPPKRLRIDFAFGPITATRDRSRGSGSTPFGFASRTVDRVAMRRASARAARTRLGGVGGSERLDIAVRVLEEPEPELRVEHAADALLNHGFVEQTVADRRRETGRVTERARELHIEPGLERLHRGIGRAGRGALPGGQRIHRAVVGDGQTVEAESAPEHVGEKATRRGRRLAVQIGVCAHHRLEIGFGDRRTERSRVHLEQFAFAQLHRADVAAPVGHGVAEEVLRGCEDSFTTVVTLEAADERDADRGAEVRILAVGLLHAAPPRVTREVEVG